jgi:signal transduction histidine kinase
VTPPRRAPRNRRESDTIGGVSGVVVEDPWQARMDRLRRLLPLPLLVVSTAGALAAPGRAGSLASVPALILVGAAAIWSVAVTARLRPDSSPNWRLAAFATHTALAGLLVWYDPWYGVFAYTGFLFAHSLGARWRKAGFAATALVVSGAMAGGYPSADPGQTFTYLLVAGVMLTLVINSASITNRALEQNRERGQMISELAEANRRLEASMAENASLHDQLLAQAREAGVVEERQRLAGEIHDTLAQGLTGIIAQLQAAEHTRHRPDEWSRHLAQAQSLARSSLTEARRSVQALRPEQLEHASLPEAIQGLAHTWTERSGITAQLDTTGTPVRAGLDTEATLFRVAQEALSNVAQHARASQVQLTLTYLDDTVLLDVADNGTGFDPATHTGGYGLTGMQQRLARVGGTLTIESTSGYGTTLNASVPLGEPSPGACA